MTPVENTDASHPRLSEATMKTHTGAKALRGFPAFLLFACASQAVLGLAPASAAPAADPIDAIIVPAAGANEVYGHDFTSSPVNSAPSEPEKALGNCGNAQAAAFSEPWTSYRSVHYSTYNNLGPTQRVAIYADEAAAARAFGKLTAQLASCKTAAPAAPAPSAQPSPAPDAAQPAGESPAPQAPASPAQTSPAQQPAAQSFTVAAATADTAKWDDYVGFSQVSGLPYHCFREAHQHAAVVLEVETCDLDDNGSLTSAMAGKMLAQIPAA
ncbi:MAG: sensor domain-containing protein [Segniliparus sp.]|uniref:sensor domain-containing protein n=1 Tax=Segniliparus sp. TaxID=2804064 RepID=UPI003F2AC1C1